MMDGCLLLVGLKVLFDSKEIMKLGPSFTSFLVFAPGHASYCAFSCFKDFHKAFGIHLNVYGYSDLLF